MSDDPSPISRRHTVTKALIQLGAIQSDDPSAGEANVAVPVGDLRPRAKNFELTLDAVFDIRFCENLFHKWVTELNKVTNDSNKQDDREQMLRLYLGRLKERAGLCSQESDEILQYHVRFASLMAQRIDDASKTQDNLISDSPEARELAEEISKASGLLSTNVERMTYEIDSFVSALKKMKVAVETQKPLGKERSLVERVLRWLKSMFKAIAAIFAKLTPSIPVIARHHPDPKVRGSVLADTALGQAASVFCRVDSEPKNGKESESLDSVILFLKDVVPIEVEDAQRKLKRLDTALEIMERMRSGQQLALGDSDPAAIAKEWRDVAEQYQSAFDRISQSLPPLSSSPPSVSNSPSQNGGQSPQGPTPHGPPPHSLPTRRPPSHQPPSRRPPPPSLPSHQPPSPVSPPPGPPSHQPPPSGPPSRQPPSPVSLSPVSPSPVSPPPGPPSHQPPSPVSPPPGPPSHQPPPPGPPSHQPPPPGPPSHQPPPSGPPSHRPPSHRPPPHGLPSHRPPPRGPPSRQPPSHRPPPSHQPPSHRPPPRGPLLHSSTQRTSQPKFWSRAVNWANGAAAPADSAAGVVVPVDYLRPLAKHVQITLDTVDEIRFCETLFVDWTTEIDKVTSNPEKSDKREEQLRSHLERLRENAWLYSRATDAILQYHAQFASIMAQRINDASRSQHNMQFDDSETTELAKNSSEASRSLSMAVTGMKDGVELFVSALQNVQAAMKHERSLAERILRWLKSLFKVIVSILEKPCRPISAVRPPAESKRQKSTILASNLKEATAKFCTADLEPQEGNESEILDSVILFLKQIVPNEADQKKLERFDEALYMKGLGSHVRAGRPVTIQGTGPAAVAGEWREVAKRYNSANGSNRASIVGL